MRKIILSFNYFIQNQLFNRREFAILTIIAFFSPVRLVVAQQFPTDYFRPPIDIPLRLTGTFAEFRYDHLHSGVDLPCPMRTPVHAVADGYVFRIRMQAGGFGRALYLKHPNGYTSLYGHLDAFNPTFEKYLKDVQYREKTFELDYYPDSTELPVKKGEIIAFSGNSGISQGPHLHFEIRQSSDESPTNPLLFGYRINDVRKPIVKNLRVYPVYIDGENIPGQTPVNIPMKKAGSDYKPKNPGVIKVPPYVIWGIQASDVDGSGGLNGLYTMDVSMDNDLVYHTGMEQFSWDNFRAVNSLIDFPYYQNTRNFIQLTR
ncbi:MAG: M23 family metallopeptidase, partial [Bacteroidetes bacterium]|nr:M23 family metallopeptidase [Bacteroidota bacterium]